MLNPLLLMGILAFVFSHLLRVTVEHFAVYLLSALVLWNFFAQSTSWSTACFASYAPMIRKIYVPQGIFVLATVLAGTVNLLISLVPLALIMVVVGHPFGQSGRHSLAAGPRQSMIPPPRPHDGRLSSTGASERKLHSRASGCSRCSGTPPQRAILRPPGE